MFGKILIVSLLLTSLIPSMSLGGSNLRYLPAFNILFMMAVYALFCLKERENREHLWAYYKGNKYVLIVVVLYIITLWISSYKTGINESIAMISGISVVLFIMHFIFPVLIKTREDFLFIPKSLFVIGLLNAIVAVEFFIRYKILNIDYANYGIASVIDISDKLNILPGLKITRLTGMFSNPNSLGILITIIFPAGLLLIMEAKKLPSKLMFASYLLLFIFVVISSFSRASILAVAISFLFYIILRWGIIYDTVRILMVVIVILLTALIISGTKLDVLRTLKITSSGRTDLWDKSIDAIQDNMAHGIGVSNIVKLLSEAAHNTYIEIALGFGVIALIMYSSYLVLTILKVKFHEDRNLSIYTLLTFSSFSVLQLFETLQFGGLSIANFYFLTSLVSYLSLTSLTYPKSH